MKHIERFVIDSHCVDCNGAATVTAVLRYMQQTANLQMLSDRPSNDDLRARGYAFVLSRLTMSLYAPLHADEEIEVETWPVESRGVSYNRCYRVLRAGAVVAEAASVWALLDLSTRRPTRVGAVEFASPTDEPLELDIPLRIKPPEGVALGLVGERPVVYSDLDFNNHMNNTNYPNMLCDFLPSMKNKRVIEMSIMFLGEATFGETLKIYRAEADGEYYFHTQRQDGGANIDAAVMLDDLY